MAVDQTRLLHRHSAYGYTSNPARAMYGEPEAVSAEAQELITGAAAHQAQAQLASEWGKCRDRVLASVSHFEDVARPPARLRSNLRVLVRTVERVDRELSA